MSSNRQISTQYQQPILVRRLCTRFTRCSVAVPDQTPSDAATLLIRRLTLDLPGLRKGGAGLFEISFP